MTAAAYLSKLNPEQRRAVEHGVREGSSYEGRPLWSSPESVPQDLFVGTIWLVAAAIRSSERAASEVRIDIGARMRAMWRA